MHHVLAQRRRALRAGVASGAAALVPGLARPAVELAWNTLPPHYRERLERNIVPAPLIDVSATQIRQRVKQGMPIDELTVPPVVEYIRANGLYRA